MNFEMAEANVRQHVNEIRDQAAQSRADRRPSARRPSDRHSFDRRSSAYRSSALRSRVGITLVEAGLRLLAADGSQPGR